MGMTVEKAKAKRQAGIAAMTPPEKIRRDLTGGRPPAGELKTPLSAVTAARTLHREIRTRMAAEGLTPTPENLGISIGYVTPDLTTIGFTVFWAPGAEPNLLMFLDGNIPLGLVFVIADESQEEKAVVGTRAFFTTKQSEEWLSGLVPIIRSELV